MFNALRYTEELEKAGFSRVQAEVSMKVLIEIMDDNFVTKADLKELEAKMELKFQGVGHAIEKLEYRLTIKLGTMLTLAIGVMTAIVKLT